MGAVNVITKVSSEKSLSDSLDNALLDFQRWLDGCFLVLASVGAKGQALLSSAAQEGLLFADASPSPTAPEGMLM